MSKDNDNPYIGSDPYFVESARDMKRYELEFLFVPTAGQTYPLTVNFMAFLTDFRDQYASEWTADKVYGRMDPIATFQGTVRTISLGWAVPAYSNEEAMNNLTKMSKLISMCYPVYDNKNLTSARGAGQITGAPLIKLKFANLISSTKNLSSVVSNGLLGWIDGITFSPNLEAGFYDPIGVAGDLQLFPKQIDLSCQFHALHEHRHGWAKNTMKVAGLEVEDDAGLSRAEDKFPYGSVSKFSTGSPYTTPAAPNEKATDIDVMGAPLADSAAPRNVEPWMDPMNAEIPEVDDFPSEGRIDITSPEADANGNKKANHIAEKKSKLDLDNMFKKGFGEWPPKN